MTSDNTDYIYSTVKPEQFADWDKLLGFPVEKILPEYFYVDRNENLVGISAVQIAMMEFDKIIGSNILTLELIPEEVMQELVDQADQYKPKSILDRFNPLSRLRPKQQTEFDPTAIMKLLNRINKVRFELFTFVIVSLSQQQANAIKQLKRSDKTRDYQNLQLAYKDIISRSSKEVRDAHFKANPNFMYYVPEDGIIINGTTKN